MNDNKRNFYGVWWGKKKRIKKNHPLAFLNIASEIEIEWSGEQKHSIPFGSDTIGGKKRGDPKPILASEKHNVSLYMPSPSRRLFGLFGNIFCLFENAVHFFFFSSRSRSRWASDECIPKLQPKAETRRMFFFTNLSSRWAKSPSKEEIRKCLCRTQPSAAISDTFRSFLLARQSVRES